MRKLRIKSIMPVICLCLLTSASVASKLDAGATLETIMLQGTADPGALLFRKSDWLISQLEPVQRKVSHPLFQEAPHVDFTFGVLPDTQYYSQSFPKTFKKMNQWFVANRASLNLKYIFHLGDIVNNFNRSYQWKRADQAMKILDDAKLPYGVVTGNHDVGDQAGHYSMYGQYFGEERFRWNPWYGGSYKDNRGHFDLIDVKGEKFIMLGIGWGIGGEEVGWMNQILKIYKDRTAILYVHDYLGNNGRRAGPGSMLFERIVRPNANVKVVLNGHRFGAARRVDQLDDDFDGNPDRKVLQILSDYQSIKGGQGYIRLLGFDLIHHRIYVRTYSPETGRHYVFKKNVDNFSVGY
ncbi:metallophosphoesterase [Sporolactobacillus sp. THM19-2]|uniref:metallophosphoesterase n=1 Tax=Sporolactobacillus sp. THM19-2 TaxID=2511171 RepID=UPI0010227073|nr:metallophosphoesterase [Sporolactobacillus sp. THM19-2]RYL89279.1 metallophosphoesterase [Sporolactobacillus sp. THM19-2]